MSSFSERLRLLRNHANLSQQELASRLGISKSSVNMYERGEREPGFETMEAIADYFNVDMNYLYGLQTQKLLNPVIPYPAPVITTDVVSIPVIGEIAAGYNEVVQEDWSTEAIEVPRGFLKGRDQNDFFFLKVHGESMYPTYQDGDMVLILKQSTINYSGCVCAILYEDECATLKRVEYAEGEDWMRLVPINPNFAPIRIDGERLDHCKIIGIPKLVIRSIEE